MVLGAAVIEEDSAAEQGRRSNGQFFHPPLERTRFTIIHLSDTGHEPRSQTTVPFPSVAPLAPRTLDRVLILGGGGILGPSVVEELGDSGDPDKLPFNLRVTDVHADKRNPGSQPLQLPESHEYVEIDIASNDEVIAAVSVSSDSQLPKASRQGPTSRSLLPAYICVGLVQVEGTDAVVNLSVMRLDRKLAFDVNTRGVYNAIMAAVAAKHDRFINTGPHFTVVGTLYDDYDFGTPRH